MHRLQGEQVPVHMLGVDKGYNEGHSESMALTFAISFGRDSHGRVTRGHVCHLYCLMHGTSSHPTQHSTEIFVHSVL